MQEGFEGGLYQLAEAKSRIASFEETVRQSEAEINRGVGPGVNLQIVKEQLRQVRDRNLDEATFEDRQLVVAKLGVTVYPSEDPKSMRVTCRLDPGFLRPTPPANKKDLRHAGPIQEHLADTTGGIVTFAPPSR